MKTEGGCVYFLKHTGLKPIKIGYSSKITPERRFNQFKTYAPFGGEIIGFINDENPILLERILQDRFSKYRLNGEWFDITLKEVEEVISIYSGKIEITKEEIYSKEDYLFDIEIKYKFLTSFLNVNLKDGLIIGRNKLWEMFILDNGKNFLFESEFILRVKYYCEFNNINIIYSTNKRRLEFKYK